MNPYSLDTTPEVSRSETSRSVALLWEGSEQHAVREGLQSPSC